MSGPYTELPDLLYNLLYLSACSVFVSHLTKYISGILYSITAITPQARYYTLYTPKLL
jgi:hypothetical protein